MESQIVLITGGSRGIGRGIARCFARRGAKLALLDVDPEAAKQAAESLIGEGAGTALGIAGDITNREDVEKAVAKIISEWGRIDVLVNNAGICPFIEIMELSPETWQRTLDVNLTGAFHCSQIVARHMIERHGEGDASGGRIVFVTSLAENVTGPNQVDYGASKGGLKMAMVGFATALGKYGITCNAVAPGMILTPMTEHHWLSPGPAAQIKERVPIGRIGTPEDIGHAVVFLASPEAAYISGVSLRVDGGHQALCV